MPKIKIRHMIGIIRYPLVAAVMVAQGKTFEHDANDRHANSDDVGNGPHLAPRHHLPGSGNRGVH